MLSNKAVNRRKEASKQAKTISQDEATTVAAKGAPPLDSSLVAVAKQEKTEAPANLLEGAQINPFAPTTPKCFGDGRDGKRIAIVVVGTPSNKWNINDVFLATVAAQQLETQLIWSSAAQNPNNIMHWRFSQKSATDCNPLVYTLNATQNDVAGYLDGLQWDPNVQSMKRNIKNLNPGNVHFLFFSKAPAWDSGVCGVGEFRADGGYSNSDADAVIFDGCWDTETPSHELLHTLGAVDSDAPHTSGAAHCWDGNDVMCYNDSETTRGRTENGNRLTAICDSTDTAQAAVLHATFDCNGDDYFSVRDNWPSVFQRPAKGASPAVNIYNIAMSGFMQNAQAQPTPVPATPAPPPATTNPAAKTTPLPTSVEDRCKTQVIGMGNQGECVSLIQQTLKNKRYDNNLVIDGVYGQHTKDLVMIFQKNAGLTQDGVVGPQTWPKLLDPNVAAKS